MSARGRVLVVDDQVAQMKAVCRTLQIEGYEVSGFNSARAALAAFTAGDFDLLLTDLQMPDMDGIALLSAAREIDANLAGVVMTGHATVDIAIKAMQTGALDYVRKPIRPNALLPAIARALGVRRLQVENAQLLELERQHVAELEAANRDLEFFSFSVSHDLRAPLRALVGFCELYVEQFGASATEDGHRILEQMMAGARRMQRLVDDLLKFCRYSRQSLAKTPVDIDALVRRIVAELQAQVLEREPGRRFDLRIHPLPICEGDAALLEQVFANLLANAFKFTRGRDVAVIEVECTTGIWSVSDNGAGFDMTSAAKLFGVFQRLHTDAEFEGTGVGLSIVQRIVERHGGRIWAESVCGSGATFFFTLGPDAHPRTSAEVARRRSRAASR